MIDLVSEMAPMKYDADLDEIVYTGSFSHLNRDMFEITQAERMDFERVTDITTWTPQKGPALEPITAEKPDRVPTDHIDALFSAVLWNN